jgi:hypothetical protein
VDFDTATDELYAVPLDEFTPRRRELAAQARQAGDDELAKRIDRLGKPRLAAWVTNQLVRERREEIDALLQLGEALRAATAELRGPDLAELSRQQRQVTQALVREAKQIATDAGQKVNDVTARAVEQTLRAALGDPDAADELASARLTEPLEYVGFPGGVTPTSSPPARRSRADGGKIESKSDARKAQARAALAAAKQDVELASRELESAEEVVSKADDRVELVSGHLDEVRRRVQQLSGQLKSAQKEQRDAHRARDQAAEELEQAKKRLADART